MLQSSQVPFSFQTTSYDRAVADVTAGRLPASDAIRVEDFLAAQQYALPPAPVGGLALHAAAAPAGEDNKGPYALQLALQGGAPRIARRPTTHVIAVVETSAAMRANGRSMLVHRALERFARQMAPTDRLTLIGFAEAPQVLAERATQAGVNELLATGVLAKNTGRADLLSAVQSACDAVAALPDNETRRVLFVTSGRAPRRSGTTACPPVAGETGPACGAVAARAIVDTG